MPKVVWSIENDRKLLIRLIERSARSYDTVELAKLFDGATPKAIEERIAKLKREARAADGKFPTNNPGNSGNKKRGPIASSSSAERRGRERKVVRRKANPDDPDATEVEEEEEEEETEGSDGEGDEDDRPLAVVRRRKLRAAAAAALARAGGTSVLSPEVGESFGRSMSMNEMKMGDKKLLLMPADVTDNIHVARAAAENSMAGMNMNWDMGVDVDAVHQSSLAPEDRYSSPPTEMGYIPPPPPPPLLLLLPSIPLPIGSSLLVPDANIDPALQHMSPPPLPTTAPYVFPEVNQIDPVLQHLSLSPPPLPPLQFLPIQLPSSSPPPPPPPPPTPPSPRPAQSPARYPTSLLERLQSPTLSPLPPELELEPNVTTQDSDLSSLSSGPDEPETERFREYLTPQIAELDEDKSTRQEQSVDGYEAYREGMGSVTPERSEDEDEDEREEDGEREEIEEHEDEDEDLQMRMILDTYEGFTFTWPLPDVRREVEVRKMWDGW